MLRENKTEFDWLKVRRISVNLFDFWGKTGDIWTDYLAFDYIYQRNNKQHTIYKWQKHWSKQPSTKMSVSRSASKTIPNMASGNK